MSGSRIQARARRVARVRFAGDSLVTRIREEAIRIMVDEPSWTPSMT
jgi:hypothetical protein